MDGSSPTEARYGLGGTRRYARRRHCQCMNAETQNNTSLCAQLAWWCMLCGQCALPRMSARYCVSVTVEQAGMCFDSCALARAVLTRGSLQCFPWGGSSFDMEVSRDSGVIFQPTLSLSFSLLLLNRYAERLSVKKGERSGSQKGRGVQRRAADTAANSRSRRRDRSKRGSPGTNDRDGLA